MNVAAWYVRVNPLSPVAVKCEHHTSEEGRHRGASSYFSVGGDPCAILLLLLHRAGRAAVAPRRYCASSSAMEAGDTSEYHVRTAWREEVFRDLADRDWAAVEAEMREAVLTSGTLPGDETEARWRRQSMAAVPTYPDAADNPNTKRQTWAVQLTYYGPDFQGFAWNQQQLTVAGQLAAAINPLLEGRHGLRLASAGRTDAGVSALGQLVSFYSWAPLSEDEVKAAINAFAPADGQPSGAIRAVSAQQVPRSFHATFSARWRRYAYLLPLREPGEGGSGAWKEVSAAALDAQLRPLSGLELNYAALGRGVPKGKDTRTTLHLCAARPVRLAGGGRPCVRVDVVGDRFIRRQVRALVSAALHCARTSDDAGALLALIRTEQQELTPHPAPAAGLCFAEAGYDEWSEDAGGVGS